MAKMLFVIVVLVFGLEDPVPRVYHSRCIIAATFHQLTLRNSTMVGLNRSASDDEQSHMTQVGADRRCSAQLVFRSSFSSSDGYAECCEVSGDDRVDKLLLPSHINDLFIKAYDAPLIVTRFCKINHFVTREINRTKYFMLFP